MRMTRKMRMLNGELRDAGHEGLRAYILAWYKRNPQSQLGTLAAELGVGYVTLYRWLDKLQIEVAAGPRLIDLDAERQKQAVADAAAAIAETEGDAPRTGSDG